MSKVEVFTTKLEDEYEIYPSALFAMFEDDEILHRKRVSIDGFQDYTHTTEIASLQYQASYWLSINAYEAKKRFKPLLNGNESLPFNEQLVLTVDLSHEESVRIMNGNLEPMQVSNELIKHDIKRRIAL